jgi:GNAT superfamily N-acetyltransferase
MFENTREHSVPMIIDQVAADRNAKERGDLVLAAMERSKRRAAERPLSALAKAENLQREFADVMFEPYDKRHHQALRAILNDAFPMMKPDEVANYVRDVSRFGVGPEGVNVHSERWWVATDTSGAPLGITGLSQYAADRPDHVWLNWFALKKDLQGSGFGKKLLAETISRARQSGMRRMYALTSDLPSMQGNYKFYQREGCVVVAVLDKTGIHVDADCGLPNAVLQYHYKDNRAYIDKGTRVFLRSKAL